MFASRVGIREIVRSSTKGLKTAMFNFDLSIFELRYNEVHCHSLKLYPFLSSKIIMVSQKLDYYSRKIIYFHAILISYKTDNQFNRNTR